MQDTILLVNFESLTWTIFGHCLAVTKCPFKSMTIKVRSLSQPDFRPNFVHSIEFTRTRPSDLTGYTNRSLNSPTFRHSEGGLSFCLFVHHHQKKTTTVPAPTTAADTYVSRVLSALKTFSNINSLRLCDHAKRSVAESSTRSRDQTSR